MLCASWNRSHFRACLLTVHSELAMSPFDIQTNYLHGPVPSEWCQDGKTPKNCRLGGVNSLCVPSSCTYDWCSLNHDCNVLNGHWSEWSHECSTTCGGGTLTRQCNNPAVKDGGKMCKGVSSKPCNTEHCPGTRKYAVSCVYGCIYLYRCVYLCFYASYSRMRTVVWLHLILVDCSKFPDEIS